MHLIHNLLTQTIPDSRQQKQLVNYTKCVK
jgi:hypothetical protein